MIKSALGTAFAIAVATFICWTAYQVMIYKGLAP